MNDFTLEPKIPDVVREIKAQKAIRSACDTSIVAQKLKRKARERKDSGLGNKSVSTKESRVHCYLLLFFIVMNAYFDHDDEGDIDELQTNSDLTHRLNFITFSIPARSCWSWDPFWF